MTRIITGSTGDSKGGNTMAMEDMVIDEANEDESQDKERERDMKEGFEEIVQ